MTSPRKVIEEEDPAPLASPRKEAPPSACSMASGATVTAVPEPKLQQVVLNVPPDIAKQLVTLLDTAQRQAGAGSTKRLSPEGGRQKIHRKRNNLAAAAAVSPPSAMPPHGGATSTLPAGGSKLLLSKALSSAAKSSSGGGGGGAGASSGDLGAPSGGGTPPSRLTGLRSLLAKTKSTEGDGSTAPEGDGSTAPAFSGVGSLLDVVKQAHEQAAAEKSATDISSGDYRSQDAEKLIAGSPDIRRMLAEVNKAQMRLMRRHDMNRDGKLDGNELGTALTGAPLGRKSLIAKLLPGKSSRLSRAIFSGASAAAAAAAHSGGPGSPGSPGTNAALERQQQMHESFGLHRNARFMASPNDRWRRAWDGLALFFTSVSIFLLPMQFAFSELGTNTGIVLLSALADLFFLSDLIVNFRTGFIDARGNLDGDPARAARRYLRTWFVPDLLAAAFPLDLIALFMLVSSWDAARQVQGGAFQTLRVLRLSKFVRVARLVMGRGGWDIDAIDPSVVTMAKACCYTLLFWHWSGLMWWVIGGEGLVDNAFGPPPVLRNATLAQKYMQCMYWTIAITSKVREPMPETRDYDVGITLFSNAVITLGLLFQAMLVGAASSVVQNLDSAAAVANRQIKKIRNYLDYQRVPQALKRRVMVYYRFKHGSKTGSMDMNEVLPDLPPTLKAQMDIVATRSIFVSIPVFQACEGHEILRMVQGLTTVLALPGDVIVEEGTLGRGLFFIMRGAVQFVPKRPQLTQEQRAEMRQKFDEFDADGGGSIDAVELINAVKALGYDVKPKEIRAMVADIDTDGSGEVEFDEFVEMMLTNRNFLVAMGLHTDVGETLELTEGFFGEESVLTGSPSRVTVRASNYSDFFLLKVEIFNSIVQGNAKMHTLVKDYASSRTGKGALDPIGSRVVSGGASSSWKKLRTATKAGCALSMAGRARGADSLSA